MFNIYLLLIYYIQYNNYSLNSMLQAQLSDIQFYIMKINRLQSDLAITQQQLMAARLRLRTAQDFQIKYGILLKQTQQQNSRNRQYERQQQSKIAQLITLKLKQRDQFWNQKYIRIEKQLVDKYSKQIEEIKEQFSIFRKKHEKCNISSNSGNKIDDQDILAFKYKKLLKQNQVLEEKMQKMKKQFQHTRQQESKQIKQSLTAKNKQKSDNQRKIYRQKIQQLQKTVQQLQDNLLQAKTKASPERQNQIQKLKLQLIQQNNKNNQEIERIRLNFQKKYNQILNQIGQYNKIQQALIQDKKQLQQYIKVVQDKLFQKQKQHEMELINIKQRMTKLREEQSSALKRQIYKIQQNIKEERQSWSIVIKDKDMELERVRNKCQQDTQRHKQDRTKQLKKIQQLKEKLKQYQGNKQQGQADQMLKSIKEVDAKQADFANYQNGVTFLDRQLKKALAKLQQKNIQVTKLVKQLNDYRKQTQQQIQTLRQKIRKDKKYYTDKIGQLQQQILDLNDQLRNRQRQFKKRQKDTEGKLAQLQKENQSLKDLVDEMQKDYTRIIQNKKTVQMSYRQQRQRGMTSKSDLTMIKKQKWLQMERQKNQLQAIYKQKQEQLKTKNQVENQKLRHQRDQLKSENEILKGIIESAKKQNPDENKQNKQSIFTQYHKKMATLNLQIALTKNIYDSLIQAKSRKTKQSKVSQFDKIQEQLSRSIKQEEQDSPFRDSRDPKFYSPSDFEKMTMSFNPKNK